MTLSQKYAALKVRVAGNRETKGFEFTHGQFREELSRTTMPGKWPRRILAEIEFGIRLSESLDDRYDSILDEALDYLTNYMNEEGTLSNSACKAAEEMLLPMERDSKEYKLILVGHAHIDMNWEWSYHETVATCLATYRTMLTIMEQYPDFCFSQSQASIYKIIEEFDPEMMEQIKMRITEGRWEVNAAEWVETDKNMPCTEALLNQIRYAKKYMKEVWGVAPESLEVDFLPDTFGHNINTAEIDAQGGIKYMYHCRGTGDTNLVLYRYKAPSGREILVYREPYWYNGGINSHIGVGAIDLAKKCAGLKTGLFVYGVGDHGGGPTRRDVEHALDMMKWPVFPALKFGTIKEYFHAAEEVRDLVPVVDKEINFLFPGCYTTQSRIKMANRSCETALNAAETMSAFASVKVKNIFKSHVFEKAWQNVLFNDFHDILPGSNLQDSREYAMGLYSKSIAYANTETSAAMRILSDAIDTSTIEMDDDISDTQAESAGVGYGLGSNGWSGQPVCERGCGLVRIYNVFNKTAVAKKEPLEITVWDWYGDMNRIQVTDVNGNELEIQLLDYDHQWYWDHRFFRILVYVETAPLAYITIILRQRELIGNYPFHGYRLEPDDRIDIPHTGFKLENEYICAKFDPLSGALISLVDKETGAEQIKDQDKAGLVLIDTEYTGAPNRWMRACSDAWHIGRYLKIHEIDRTANIYTSIDGALRKGIHFESNVLNSKIHTDIYLDKNAHSLTYNIEVHWNEVGGETIPVLAYRLPVAYETDNICYNIPAGSIVRSRMDMDTPGLSYALALSGKEKNLGIVSNFKYGYRAATNGDLYSTLINTATYPDPAPERGIHKITMHVGVFSSCPKIMEETAVSLINPMLYQPALSHKGTLPASGEFFKYDAKSAVLSSISMDGDALLVRFYSYSDAESDIHLAFDKTVTDAKSVDLFGSERAAKITVDGNNVTAVIEPKAIMTLKISF